MRRFALGVVVALAALTGLAMPASAQEERHGDDNQAIAINTEDGGSVFRLALSVRMVTNGVVDQTNTAVALASCTDCQTVALALQVVLVRGDADVVAPVNQAVALNTECALCVTYASATQIVLGFDGHVRLDGEGRRRLAELYRSLRDLEDQAPSLSLVELDAAVQEAKRELIEILRTSLVVKPTPADGSTTTSSSSSSTTSTTVEDDGDTTTTTEPSTTSTTSTTEPEPTTSTTEPEPTTTSTP